MRMNTENSKRSGSMKNVVTNGMQQCVGYFFSAAMRSKNSSGEQLNAFLTLLYLAKSFQLEINPSSTEVTGIVIADEPAVLIATITETCPLYDVAIEYSHMLQMMDSHLILESATYMRNAGLSVEDCFTLFDLAKEYLHIDGLRNAESGRPYEFTELIQQLHGDFYGSIFDPFSGNASFAALASERASFTGVEIMYEVSRRS